MAKWKKSKIITLSSILAVLLVGIIVFLCFVPTIQARTEQKKYYNSRVAVFELENKEIRTGLQKIDVVFMGDQITESYKLAYHFENVAAVNRGIKGDTVAGMTKRLKVSAFELNPKILILQFGTNMLNKVSKDIEPMLKYIKENLQANVFVQSILPTSGKYADRNEKIVEINKKLEKLAKEYGFIFIDTHLQFYQIDDKEMTKYYTDDGLTLNSTGYNRLTEFLKPYISQYLNKK